MLPYPKFQKDPFLSVKDKRFRALCFVAIKAVLTTRVVKLHFLELGERKLYI